MRQKAIRDLILKEQLEGIPKLHSISDIDINFGRSKFMFCGIYKLLLNHSMLQNRHKFLEYSE